MPPISADYVTCHLDEAFAGDPDAAHALVVSAPNANRGYVARAMYEAGVRGEALRVVLDKAWNHDHAWLSKAAGTWRRFVRMFRDANFEIPDSVSDPVTIWRGTAGLEIDDAAEGKSWTLDRDVACWFAMRGERREPLVIRATCPRRSIIFYTDQRNEAEVIPELLRDVTIDGNKADWRRGGKRYDGAKQKRREARMQAIREGCGAA